MVAIGSRSILYWNSRFRQETLTSGLPKFISGSVLTYLEHQIGSGNPVPTKNALQDLCRLYRRGYRIHPNNHYAMETTLVGLSHRKTDLKVKRWALNGLAHIGRKDSRDAIIRAIEDHVSDPEIVTAGVAALYKLSRMTAETDLRRLNFPSQMITLAALQHIRPEELTLHGLPVNIQTADPETIKAALLIIGLNRAPQNLLDPNYSNAEIVKVLGKHDDAMVSQYSVWAITENSSLSINDMGIDLPDVASRPDNVRSWAYRLFAMNETYCLQNLDFMEQATEDMSIEARLGLARGLKDTFFGELVSVVLNWFTSEMNADVRQEILDHVITHSYKSPAYYEHAVDAYQRANPADQERMRGTAAGTALFSAFRRLDYQSEGDLFVTNNTFNINNSQVAALSGSGNAVNTGQFIQYTPHVTELLRDELTRAGTVIEGLIIPEKEKEEVTEAITIAQADTNSSTLKRVTEVLSKAAGVVTNIAGAEDTLNQIIQGLSKLAGLN
ncbi:HEAT repeat domain-containing protein [Nguyenibacter vanlangensis]|uniref:HEAT repeat domain-containing protein n=1 Tax=Nguyenibacter vanlangensis TaxID=1216886 RepID=A0ABZ3DAE5_9PROT